MKPADTARTFEDVTSGAFKTSHLIYARKSTDDPDNQKNSIQYQKGEALRHAARTGVEIAHVTLPAFCTDGIVSERHSAFSEAVEVDFGDDGAVQFKVERPKFHRLMEYLSKGYFKGVIVLCWDRFSRNKADEVIIRKLMKAGVDIRFVRTQYDKGSAGELHMDIDGMFSEHHSRVTREKVSDTIRDKRAQGYCTHRANVGYLNEGRMEWKPFDPDRAPIVARLFELADTTDWSLSDLRRWAIEQGFTMPPARRKRTEAERLADEERDDQTEREKICRPPTVTNIHYILTSPFYAGKVRGNDGVWVKSASHEPLVSEDRFVRIQAKLARRRTSLRHPKVLTLPFRGLVRCQCGRVYTPYVQKGIVYYGARCDRSCANGRKSVNFGFVDQQLARLLQDLWLTDEELADFEGGAEETRATEAAKAEVNRHDAERRTKTLREDLAYLTENKLTLLRTGAYTAESLAEELARLERELTADTGKTSERSELICDLAEAVVRLSELVKNVALLYEKSKPELRDRIVRPIISELTVLEDTANVRCKRAFDWLEARLFQQCALCWSPSELLAHREELDAVINELREVLNVSADFSDPDPDVPQVH